MSQGQSRASLLLVFIVLNVAIEISMMIGIFEVFKPIVDFRLAPRFIMALTLLLVQHQIKAKALLSVYLRFFVLYWWRSHWFVNDQVVRGLTTSLLLLACVFANCSVHATQLQQVERLVAQQMNNQMSSNHQHDCCEPQVKCCEGHQGVFTPTSLDNPTGDNWQFDGFAVDSLSSYIATKIHCYEKPQATGPPIHLMQCRFTI